MSLLFIDGFDHYATADIAKKWTTTSGAVAISAGNGRRSSSALNISSINQFVKKTFATGVATIIVGFAWKPLNNGSSGNPELLNLFDGATSHIAMNFNATNRLEIRRGGYTGTLLATSTTVFGTGTYYFIELKVTISDSAGVVVLKINGATDINLSSVDTRNAGNASVDTVTFGGSSSSAHSISYIDDVYICDGLGSAPQNDFLGDSRIDTLFPNADGSNSAWTPSTGTTHYTLVDETTPNTTDYVESNVVGSKDTWNFQNLTAITGTIYGAQICTAALKDDAGARSFANTLKSGATNADGAAQVMSTSQLYFMDIFATDPATAAAWTESAVNAAEFGVKVAA